MKNKDKKQNNRYFHLPKTKTPASLQIGIFVIHENNRQIPEIVFLFLKL